MPPAPDAAPTEPPPTRRARPSRRPSRRHLTATAAARRERPGDILDAPIRRRSCPTTLDRRRAGAPRPSAVDRGRWSHRPTGSTGTGAESRRGPTSGRLLRSSAVVGVGTGLSRLTGLLRVLALFYALRFTSLADAYNLANTTPNIIYELLLGGVLSATLVPVFVERPSTATTTTRSTPSSP